MPINFPQHPDVQLDNAPVAEVVCQVRFPPILRIVQEMPGEFQERVRGRFPALEIEQNATVTFPSPFGSGSPALEVPPRIYRFRAVDGETEISLAVDFFAVSTRAYSHWSDFASNLRLVAEAVQEVYQPAYAMRIGLRYVNRFTPTSTNRQNMDEVLQLLRPELSSLFSTDAWAEPTVFVTQVTLPDDSGALTIRTAYGETEGESSFLLDFDYYEDGPLKLDGLIERCERYHRIIYNAFRWSLRGASLEMFRPLTAGE